MSVTFDVVEQCTTQINFLHPSSLTSQRRNCSRFPPRPLPLYSRLVRQSAVYANFQQSPSHLTIPHTSSRPSQSVHRLQPPIAYASSSLSSTPSPPLTTQTGLGAAISPPSHLQSSANPSKH
ncbi:hypothetical protein EV356DRAFT_208396 [Viridothelium virens]|uniref:Uncharacterized protein n=1 Tax=Viridothelium virens TaxID=1048519 RepID=A0A6A6H6D6_VIRVR|nr:hypothetical protein EV356DRAFT_208396 [Viridothelium virens]